MLIPFSLFWHFCSYPEEGWRSQSWPAVFSHSADMAGIWAQTSHSHQHVTCPVSMWVMDSYLETRVLLPRWLPSAGAISVWCPSKSRTLMLLELSPCLISNIETTEFMDMKVIIENPQGSKALTQSPDQHPPKCPLELILLGNTSLCLWFFYSWSQSGHPELCWDPWTQGG